MIVPFEKIRTWRERIGQSAEFPLHVPTDVERAMVAEIADLRVAVEQTQVSAAALADRFAEARLDDFFATTFGTNDPACHDYATLKMALRRLRASEGQAQTSAAVDVLAERRRQVESEGYDHENDDAYVNDEMAAAAAFYVMPPGVRDWPMEGSGYGATMGQAIYPDWMPPRTGDRRRELVKGAALTIAEIERIDRVARSAHNPAGGDHG